jgi:hypothetical protein
LGPALDVSESEASSTPARLRVAILTCGPDVSDMTVALARRPSVELLATVCTPPLRGKSARRRLENVYRYHGARGLALLPLRKAGDLATALGKSVRRVAGGSRSARTLRFDNFHSDACLAALRALELDALVIDGTYVLRESVFSLARRAALNIHCGKLPEYRGAPPCFWEVYNGESEVGVTVHGVTADLDAGPIYNQRVFPLERCPRQPALDYVRDTWLTVLRPAGVELMALTLDQMAAGTACPEKQTASFPVYKRPTYQTVRTLQSRVDARCRAK